MAFLRAPSNDKKTSLILFPFAGGSGEYYHTWLNQFAPDIDVQYCELPGRGRRMHEPAFDSVGTLTEALTNAVLKQNFQSLNFFGHSMGALIAFELAKKLQLSGIKINHLFLSGHRAPCIPYPREPLHNLSEQALYQKMIEMGGLPASVTLGDLKPFLNTIYRDFKLCETFQYPGKAELSCPITLLWGKQDAFIDLETIRLWQEETLMPIKTQAFEGNHFYLNHHQQGIIDLINQTLKGDMICQ